ncbi:MAG: hypothetical protein D6762_02180 [Candidatus Neomarinimicrobiota bacterium]|nr:MAG: hypothetical protein D6762_02180 [Candidatus Neomarinimicrobiota bacterium]
MLGIPSIAISINAFHTEHWDTAQAVAKLFASQVMAKGLPGGTLLNINVPDCRAADLKGIRVARQGQVYFKDWFDQREDPRGRRYYWMTGEIVDPSEDERADSVLLQQGYVTLTPIHYQLTREDFLSELETWDLHL